MQNPNFVEWNDNYYDFTTEVVVWNINTACHQMDKKSSHPIHMQIGDKVLNQQDE